MASAPRSRSRSRSGGKGTEYGTINDSEADGGSYISKGKGVSSKGEGVGAVGRLRLADSGRGSDSPGTAVGFVILNKVKAIQLEVEFLKKQLDRQRGMLDNVISMTDDLECMAVGLIVLGT